MNEAATAIGVPSRPTLRIKQPTLNRDDLTDTQGVLPGKIKIPLVMGWNPHEGSLAVFRQDVITDPHRDRLSGQWMLDKQAARHTRLATFNCGRSIIA
ncbi:hypothetical protein D3C80_1775960 [compost metagenome]